MYTNVGNQPTVAIGVSYYCLLLLYGYIVELHMQMCS